MATIRRWISREGSGKGNEEKVLELTLMRDPPIPYEFEARKSLK